MNKSYCFYYQKKNRCLHPHTAGICIKRSSSHCHYRTKKAPYRRNNHVDDCPRCGYRMYRPTVHDWFCKRCNKNHHIAEWYSDIYQEIYEYNLWLTYKNEGFWI